MNPFSRCNIVYKTVGTLFYTFFSSPLSLAFLLCSVVQIRLSFRTQPVSVVQKQGGAVLLRCVARPASARLTWLFQGQPLQTGALSGVEVHPGSLSLSSLQPQHTGSYQCVARSGTDAIASRQARVTIACFGLNLSA